jgi:hypothetical protein
MSINAEALQEGELAAHCTQTVLGWGPGHPGRERFNPSELADALLLAERLGEADLVLHRFAGDRQASSFWLAWFGDGPHAAGPTAALALCRAALLYVLHRRQPAG